MMIVSALASLILTVSYADMKIFNYTSVMSGSQTISLKLVKEFHISKFTSRDDYITLTLNNLKKPQHSILLMVDFDYLGKRHVAAVSNRAVSLKGIGSLLPRRIQALDSTGQFKVPNPKWMDGIKVKFDLHGIRIDIGHSGACAKRVRVCADPVTQRPHEYSVMSELSDGNSSEIELRLIVQQ